MSLSIFGRRRKWLLGLALGATVVLFIFSSLPLLVEHFVLPTLLERAGLSQYRVAVSRFGAGNASFHISASSSDALVTGGTLKVQWSVPGLLQRRLDRVVLDGLLVNLPLPGGPEKDTQKVSSEPPQLPLTVEEIQVVNSIIVLRDQGRVTSLPVSLSAQLLSTEKGVDSGTLRYRIRLDVAEYGVLSDCTYDPGQGKLFGQLQAEIPLASLKQLSHLSLPLTALDGRADLTGVYDVRLAPFLIERVEAQVLFTNLHIAGADMVVQSTGEETTAITVSGGKGSYLVQGTGFVFTEPLMATLAIDTRLIVAEGATSWQGNVFIQPTRGLQFGDRIELDEAVLIQLRHEGEIANGRTEAKITGTIGLEEKNSSSRFVVREGENVLKMDSLAVDGRLVFQPQRRTSSLEIDFVLNGKELEIDSQGMKLIIPEFGFQGTGSISDSSESKDLSVTGSLMLKNGSLDMQKQGVYLQGIHLSLPYIWPGQQQSAPGDFRIENISLQQGRLGAFFGSVRQVGQKVSLQGDLQTALMPDKAITLDAALRLGQGQGPLVELSFGVENGRMDVQDIAALYPELSSVTGSANLDIQGKVSFDACGMDGELSAQLYKGNFGIPEADFELEDVRLSLHVPNLQHLETDPAQKFSIGTIRSNKFIVHDIQTLFRVESPESLFIERISGKWSGGRIFAGSFRLQKGKQELELALFCDRLELAGILSQFGLAEAGGKGRMSGRIPLVYKNGEIFVDDGFLFTSPGEKGNLKIRQSKYLSVGMPADTVQFSPLHFAGAALSDFEYNWAKLNILSEEGDLLLKLQIAGKPREKLPYRYDATSNVFVRLEDEASGGLDQPVKLDVNFKVPVNDLFRYQAQIMPLFRNLK